MCLNGFLRTVVTLLALSTARIIAGMYESMTYHEKKMMNKGEFVFSTLSSQRLEALFKDFEIAYFREVKLNSTLTDDRDKWSVYLCLPDHHSTIQVRDTRGERCTPRIVQER